MASLNGVNVAIFQGDSSPVEGFLHSLSASIDGIVSVAGNLDELNEIVSSGGVQAAICFDGNSDGQLPRLDDLIGSVSGRVPIIIAAPDGCQNAIISAFRRGVSDGLVVTDALVPDIVAAIKRLQTGGKLPSLVVPDQLLRNDGPSLRLLAPEDLLHKLDELLIQAKGKVGVLAIQIMEVEYFARKFGQSTIDVLTREIAQRLVMALQETGYFCRRSDSTFVAILSPVESAMALEMKINRISNQINFLAQVSDLDFRIETVTGACDPSIVEDGLAAVERADEALKKARGAQVSYHIAGPNIDGVPLQSSSVRRRRRKMERRGGERTSVHKRGRVFLAHLNASVDCLVLDVSRSGARLGIDLDLSLPDEFDLMLSYHGERQRARLRWRRQKQVGVEFIKPAT